MRELIVMFILIGMGLTLVTHPDRCRTDCVLRDPSDSEWHATMPIHWKTRRGKTR